ncbi:DNA repair protein [Pseudoduganella violacea]|uniref:Exonuclease SbcC n=1 Tax=Pseudoduganella violacea TaxID=1715466 RepID=A0A7W5FWX4_9BURK|nr:DNA repair protein [Pseudoduganella violacea]MBB3121703.1 exonuclease SbcC [Pseudoduganella violacea]
MLARHLTLTGFIGIRDGLGHASITLDFARDTAGAALVAITGRNGRGKTTILDNMTPYPVMPSKAGQDGLGAFSYYDEVYLPENEKILEWEMHGVLYRSHLVIRLGGKRRTEAYLHQHNGQDWEPARLADGTLSDGRMESYQRCVEAIAGPAATFFTTAFSAQHRRQLSAYRHAEIKGLLADLLGLEQLKALSAQAGDTARLLRTGLSGLREQLTALRTEQAQLQEEDVRLDATVRGADLARQNRHIALARLDTRKAALAALHTEQVLAADHDARRSQLLAERQQCLARGRATLADIGQQIQAEQARLLQARQRYAQRMAAWETDLAALRAQRTELQDVLQTGPRVARAASRLPLLQRLHARRSAVAEARQAQVRRCEQLQTCITVLQAQLKTVEHEAGLAVLKAQELRQRFALTTQVPCHGSALQERCQLLADARAAQPLLPDASATVQRLNTTHQALLLEAAQLKAQLAQLAGAPDAFGQAAARLRRTQAALANAQQLAAREADIRRASANLSYAEARIGTLLAQAPTGETGDGDGGEQDAVAARLATLAAQEAGTALRERDALACIDALLATLPQPPDPAAMDHATRALTQAQTACDGAEAAFLATLRAQQQREELARRHASNVRKEAILATHAAHIESQLAIWLMFAKSMGNEGIVALVIEDAGPDLSALTNDLLAACYGPRFSVAIRTQLENSKGDVKEGFEITVHDAENGSAKSVAKMSGGERIWINECLTRAMALYLNSTATRRPQTLFSDEADGAFDEQHKRQFMAMKREVLRIGGYAQEYFISHTPELAAMADAVIDLDQFVPLSTT